MNTLIRIKSLKPNEISIITVERFNPFHKSIKRKGVACKLFKLIALLTVFFLCILSNDIVCSLVVTVCAMSYGSIELWYHAPMMQKKKKNFIKR